MILPFLWQAWDKYYREDILSTYWEEVSKLGETDLEKYIKNAREYNLKLYEASKLLSGETFSDEILSDEYLNILAMSDDGIMGSIEIPKISLRLPIFHGTSEEVLTKGIGHLKGSGLPVGGKNVHSILTGHRGLPNAQLFTRLDEIEEEDIFYVKVCDEMLIYRVNEIQVVKPEEVEVLEIEEGKDKISLITCTPYGLNTHRLVVTGERVEKVNNEYEEIKDIDTNLISRRDVILLIILFIFLVAAILKWNKNRNKKKKRKYSGYVIFLLLLCLFPSKVMAAEGNVEIVLPDGNQKCISYAKVADKKNNKYITKKEYIETGLDFNDLKTAIALENAAEKLDTMIENSIKISVDGKEKVKIDGLDEGVYLFQIEGTWSWNPILVYVPNWIESEMAASYDITVIPKYVEQTDSPETGWQDFGEYFLVAFLLSFAVILKILWKNNFRYGKLKKYNIK